MILDSRIFKLQQKKLKTKSKKNFNTYLRIGKPDQMPNRSKKGRDLLSIFLLDIKSDMPPHAAQK